MTGLSQDELWAWAKALGCPLPDPPKPPEAPAEPDRGLLLGQLVPGALFTPPMWSKQ